MTPADARCPHTERTAHFLWTCTVPNHHDGHIHLLTAQPLEEAA